MSKKSSSKVSVQDLNLSGKKVFIRVDFNVPIQDGKVADDTRIQAALPTIRLVREKGASLILASHLGRPKGERKPEFSLAPVAVRLGELLGEKVTFVDDCIGDKVDAAVKALEPGDVLLLENVRFYNGETKNDPEFARQLAGLADEFVNDAFGTAHRAHASTVGVPTVLGKGAAGLLIDRELKALSKVLHGAEKPLAALFGGAKVSDKIQVIENYLPSADTILLGGGMAFTFFKAQGKEIGNSLLEEDKLDTARELLARAKQLGVDFVLPVDVVVAPEFKADAESRIVSSDEIPAGWMGLDIGPKTVELFRKKLAEAKTVIWNGPLGVFEMDQFAKGTLGIAEAVAASSAFSLIGGGDSVSAVKKAGVADQVSHISTGGGASLEFLAGKELPGIAILTDKEN
ncbi:MAG: phosphoglycerate kinase [Acidobacteriota bacterium]|nr:MAG: phosphoglycerate kinase [Acidobacteriota bacterium]